MKVLCIKDSPGKGYSKGGKVHFIPENLRVYFGETYTVISQEKGFSGGLKYKLEERPKNYGYYVDYFSPLSEVDETEMIREIIKEMA